MIYIYKEKLHSDALLLLARDTAWLQDKADERLAAALADQGSNPRKSETEDNEVHRPLLLKCQDFVHKNCRT